MTHSIAFADDIYAEPSDIDVDTLANLGPLAGMAGIWKGARGQDVAPKSDGAQTEPFIDRIELQPIDPQTSGPQLLYGLRYHQHVVKPGQIATFHDQIGYWLWEPATGRVMQTLAIPRGQTAMAGGKTTADAREFELVAMQGVEDFGILSNPFLDYAFRTVEYRIEVKINADGSWSYEEDTVLRIRGKSELFHHTDSSTLLKIGEPTPNPLARK
jgi:hypothetical protein